MKKIFSYMCIAMASLTALSVVSCNDDDYRDIHVNVEQGGAFLYSDTVARLQYAPTDDQTVTIKIGRTDSTITQTFALTGDNDKFQVPATVTFEVGEKYKDVAIPFTLEIGDDETLTVSLSDEDAYTYGNKTVSVNVWIDYTWVNIGTGTFNSTFFEREWDQVVIKAAEANVYRLPDLYADGYEITFTLTDDGQHLAESIALQPTGYVHSSYGMVYIENGWDRNSEGYPDFDIEREDNTITIPLAFRVSAGYFEFACPEVLTLPE